MSRYKSFVPIALLATAMICEAAADRAAVLREARLLIGKDELSKALVLLSEAEKRDPSDSQVVYLRGYVLYRQNEFAAAKRELKAALDLTPPGLQSRYILGRIAQAEGRPMEAIHWLEACASSSPSVEDAPARMSKLNWDTGQIEQARIWTEKAIAATPWDGSLHYRLARIYQQTGETELAEREFKESMKSKTADSDGVRKLMECWQALSLHDRTTALRIRGEFLSESQLDPDLLVALGTSFATAGALGEAVDLYRASAARDPKSFQAQFDFGLALLNLKRPAEAVEPLEASVRLAPESKQVNAALALAYVMQDKFKEAVPALEAARQADPGDSKTAGLLSVAYYRSGESSKAIPLLRESIKKSGEDPKFYFLLIDCLNATEQQQEALNAAGQAVERFPQVAKAWLSKGQQLARLGQYHEAGPFFAKAAELAPDQIEPLLGLAEAEQKDGNYQAALDSYRRALTKDGDVTASLGASRSLIFLGRMTEARALLEQAVKENADNSQVHFELSRVYARLGEKDLATEQTKIVQRLRTQGEQGNRVASAPR